MYQRITHTDLIILEAEKPVILKFWQELSQSSGGRLDLHQSVEDYLEDLGVEYEANEAGDLSYFYYDGRGVWVDVLFEVMAPHISTPGYIEWEQNDDYHFYWAFDRDMTVHDTRAEVERVLKDSRTRERERMLLSNFIEPVTAPSKTHKI